MEVEPVPPVDHVGIFYAKTSPALFGRTRYTGVLSTTCDKKLLETNYWARTKISAVLDPHAEMVITSFDICLAENFLTASNQNELVVQLTGHSYRPFVGGVQVVMRKYVTFLQNIQQESCEGRQVASIENFHIIR